MNLLSANDNPLLAAQKMQVDFMVRDGATPVDFTLLNGWIEPGLGVISAVENKDQIFVTGVVINYEIKSGDFIKLNSTASISSSIAMAVNNDDMSVEDLIVNGMTISNPRAGQVIIFSATFSKSASKSDDTDKEKVKQYFDFSFPELVKFEEEFDFFYENLYKTLPKKYWRGLWVEAMAYRIAHAIAMRNLMLKGGDTGTVPQTATSKTIGKMSVGYGAAVGEDAYAGAGEFAATLYGRHFWYLLNLTKPTGVVV